MERKRDGRARWRLALLLVATASATTAPFWFLGNASGHDFEFHVANWIEVAQQWRDGILYPRWAAMASYGYGEPRFIFYPPASWMTGAALSFVAPWRAVPGVYITLCLVLAGWSMYLLARTWLPPPNAAAAAFLYAVCPYHLVIIYWRSDFAELLACAVFPLILLGGMRVDRGPRQVAWLALAFAASWLMNLPASVVATYSLALLLVVLAVGQRSWKPLVFGGCAMALAFALVAFYLLPAAYEQRWVNIAQALSPGVRPLDNFLFTRLRDPEHTVFNFLVSKVAIGEMAATAVAGVLVWRVHKRMRETWWDFAILGLVASLLMFSATSLLVWKYAPEMKFVQFPWRWLIALDVVFAGFLATAFAKVPRRLWALALLLLAICGFGVTRGVWWDPGGIHELQAEIARDGGYEGTDEYSPLGSDRYDLPREAPRVAAIARAARVRIESWGPVSKRFSVDAGEPVKLAIRLVDYPAWRATVNGRGAEIGANEDTGQMQLELPTGRSQVRVWFARTPDRTAGAAISASGLLLWLGLMLVSGRLQPRVATGGDAGESR